MGLPTPPHRPHLQLSPTTTFLLSVTFAVALETENKAFGSCPATRATLHSCMLFFTGAVCRVAGDCFMDRFVCVYLCESSRYIERGQTQTKNKKTDMETATVTDKETDRQMQLQTKNESCLVREQKAAPPAAQPGRDTARARGAKDLHPSHVSVGMFIPRC